MFLSNSTEATTPSLIGHSGWSGALQEINDRAVAILVLLASTLALFFSPATTLHAQSEIDPNLPPELINELNQNQMLSNEIIIENSDVIQALPQKIKSTWQEIIDAEEYADMKTVSDSVDDLAKMMGDSGIVALEDYSNYLIIRGEIEASKGEIEVAKLYLSKALQLSPKSPRILVRSVPLVKATNGRAMDQLKKAASNLWSAPEIVFAIIKSSFYPILWALSFGLYLTVLLFLLSEMPAILRAVAASLPAAMRGFTAPIGVLFILAIPCLTGPIPALMAWSIVVYLFIPKRRWIGWLVGLLLISWGVVIPLRENLNVWLQNTGVQTVLRVISGVSSQLDLGRIKSLADERPDDGAVRYILAQKMRIHGDLEGARNAFSKAEELWPNEGYTRAQLGAISLEQGKIEEAIAYFEEAQSMGLESAEFYFNYSKAKNEKIDIVGSEQMLKQAFAIDRHAAELLVKREESERGLGTARVRVIGDVPLPPWLIFKSAFSATPESKRIAAERAGHLLLASKISPFLVVVCGVVIIALSFMLRPPKQREHGSAFYRGYQKSGALKLVLRIVPGGGWVLGGVPLVAFVAISLSVLMLLPIIGWPPECAALFDIAPELRQLYLVFAAVIVGVCSIMGMFVKER